MTGRYSADRLGAHAKPQTQRTARQAMSLAGATAVSASLLGILTAGSTTALWQDGVTLNAGAVVSGTIDMQITGTLNDITNRLPGERVVQQLTMTNGGDVDLDISAVLDVTPTNFEVRFEITDTACGAVLSTPAVTAGTPVDLGTVTIGHSRNLCVEVTALDGVQPSETLTAIATVTGDQIVAGDQQ
ncbi:hypothetical protein GCM10009808_16660 [Microbacterium sediminicola]|uniref:SipW-cognate class signal peptide n=1 Tax=Microbacterium sediminicola TaxID=415210 RepID=A0ABN2I6Z5_9MICO